MEESYSGKKAGEQKTEVAVGVIPNSETTETQMRFKEGDNVFIGGYSGGASATVMKALENSNRYRLKTTYNGKTGSLYDAKDVYKTLKEYHENYIEFAKGRIEQAKKRFEDTKELFEKKISESEECLKTGVVE